MTGERLDGLLSLADVATDTPLGDPDDEGLAELRELGKALTNGLFQSLRILSIHSSENEAVHEPLRRLVKALRVLLSQSSSVHFITVEGQIYLNDLRIKMEASAYSNVVYLVTQLDKHGIGGITFSRVLNEAELKTLVTLILHTKPPTDPDADRLDHIRAALAETGLDGVTLDRPYYFKSGDTSAIAHESEEAQQERSALSYAKGVLAVKDYFRAVEAAEAANPLRIRKIVHDLVDVSEDEPENFLKLHTIHGVEDAYYNHCVNVATLAVTIGRTLGLTRVELADLGAAAMFHDLGYAAIERQEREEGREFSPADRMRLHTVAGFRSLLKQAEYGPGLLRRLLVTLEHHMTWKRPGGYPSLGRKSLSVFTRIVQVADYYDALVTPAAGKPGLLPVKALERIVAGSGLHFDPIVVRALVQVVGRYPYGSLVKLSSGEIGVVTSGGRDEQRFSRPTVMIVRSGDGREVPPHPIDLAEPDILRRRVAAVLDPHDADLTPHAVLFDQLDTEREEVEAPTATSSFDSESWNRAIWEGEDVEELITGSMPTVPDTLPPRKHTSPPPPPPSQPPAARTSGGQAIAPDAPGALESTAEWDETGVAREIAAVWDEDPVSEDEERALLGPHETPPAGGKDDVLAWLDAAIEASQPSMPSVQDEHLAAPRAAEPSVEFTFDFGDEQSEVSEPAEASDEAELLPDGPEAAPRPEPRVRVLSPPPPLPAATLPRASPPPPRRSTPPPPPRRGPSPPPRPAAPSPRAVAPAPPPSPATSDLPKPDEGLVIESPPDTWEEAEIEEALANIAASPDSSPASEEERSRLIGEAFAEGGEAAVMALMERWGKGL